MLAALRLAYPPLLAAAFVLSIYTDTPVSLPHALRALAVAVIGVAGLQLGLSLLLRSAAAGAFATAAVLLVVVFTWIMLVLVVGGAWLHLRLSRLGRRALPSPTTLRPAAPLFTLGLCAVVMASGVSNGSVGLPRPSIAQVAAAQASTGPDIFVILLDAYARADTLVALGHDNRPFLADLEQRGFQVAEQSRSNYSRTGLTLASMFHMAYVADIPALASPPDGYNQQHRLISDTLQAGSPALDRLRAAGYETFSIPSQLTQYAIEPVDHVMVGGELDSFEIHLLCTTLLGSIVSSAAAILVYEQQRSRIREAFATIASLAGEPHQRGRFVFGHLMAPHPPFIFDDQGNPTSLPDPPSACGILEPPGDPELRRAQYLDQLTYTNVLVLQTVDSILTAEPDALIVLMSDHGSRLEFTDFAESTSNFMAIRADQVIVPTTMTPVALFPMLFNGYLGTHLQLPQPHSFASLEGTPWPMREVP